SGCSLAPARSPLVVMIFAEFGSIGALVTSWCQASFGDGTKPFRAPLLPTVMVEQATGVCEEAAAAAHTSTAKTLNFLNIRAHFSCRLNILIASSTISDESSVSFQSLCS